MENEHTLHYQSDYISLWGFRDSDYLQSGTVRGSIARPDGTWWDMLLKATIPKRPLTSLSFSTSQVHCWREFSKKTY